ncbi:UDP-N-acetylmuramate dehydrogenase [Echinicola jeungdonensis]|uniref:UDP-N-acetylenolpyruvoylglucosamine reductase n=1 Tax=Echinicola jeungdonensis TaxID=709343 RepID=A0ABV5J0A4_9BACT|nr:UDP-N-acetylmuramate dehydrogenase [Echinicola jeungdonensis]MDN3671144.1 UDP-N-acetylmuramate dehydrogenase [Echinicola jeungdonensis]
MNIQENISLKAYNTFGIDKKARFFTRVHSNEEVIKALKTAKDKYVPAYILGGGSNILLTKDLFALVVKIDIKGVQVLKEDGENIWVKVGAGEIWHDFVLKAIAHKWAGIENLSLIPGTVGASPMQNIGAYGVEIKEVFEELEAVNRETLSVEKFNHSQCQFGYRESIFKNKAKDKYVITHVTFKLSKKPHFNISYGSISNTLKKMGYNQHDLTIEAISKAVIHIRQEKLPDPQEIGNAGSFFKNPTIPEKHFQTLKEEYPDIPGFPLEKGVKIPAAWLIDKAGWKGKTFGEIGVHKNQPLVLVNYGKGEGEAIKALSEKIQKDIQAKFGISLQPEVNFV